jgi:hypothetical protein
MGPRVVRPSSIAPRLVLGLSAALSLGLTAASGGEELAPGEVDAAVACPTRFDYLVLASFADAPNVLGLTAYNFQRHTRFSDIPITGLQRVAFRQNPGAAHCGIDDRQQSATSRRRIRGNQGEVGRATLVPNDVASAGYHDRRSGNQAG